MHRHVLLRHLPERPSCAESCGGCTEMTNSLKNAGVSRSERSEATSINSKNTWRRKWLGTSERWSAVVSQKGCMVGESDKGDTCCDPLSNPRASCCDLFPSRFAPLQKACTCDDDGNPKSTDLGRLGIPNSPKSMGRTVEKPFVRTFPTSERGPPSTNDNEQISRITPVHKTPLPVCVNTPSFGNWWTCFQYPCLKAWSLVASFTASFTQLVKTCQNTLNTHKKEHMYPSTMEK